MSNVKAVHVTGKLPFDCTKHHDLARFLAAMNGPVFGLRIVWGSDCEYRPNAHGGKTCFVPFTVAGEEAVSYDWLVALLKAVVNADGEVSAATARDIENNGRAIPMPVPAKGPAEFVAEFRVSVANPELLDKAEPAWSLGMAIRDRLTIKLAKAAKGTPLKVELVGDGKGPKLTAA